MTIIYTTVRRLTVEEDYDTILSNLEDPKQVIEFNEIITTYFEPPHKSKSYKRKVLIQKKYIVEVLKSSTEPIK